MLVWGSPAERGVGAAGVCLCIRRRGSPSNAEIPPTVPAWWPDLAPRCDLRWTRPALQLGRRRAARQPLIPELGPASVSYWAGRDLKLAPEFRYRRSQWMWRGGL